jgi:hypothetical protein
MFTGRAPWLRVDAARELSDRSISRAGSGGSSAHRPGKYPLENL